MATKKRCTCSSSDNDAQRYRHLADILKEYRDKPGALIPVLQMAQGLFGYLPETVLKKISLGLDKPFSEVAGVVSFYSFFSTNPRGEHLIRVCLGTACYVRGGKQVLDAIKKKLGIEVGETTSDNKFSLEVARCFGACGLAPTMSIDDEVFKRVRPIKINEIIDKYYRKRKSAAAKG
jgi:NADH:ubiquinone oxidoreductase subunit E